MYQHKLEEMFDFLVGSSLEVVEQERTIDFSQLSKGQEWEEICFILQVLLTTDVETLKKLKIPTKNYFLVQLYQEYLRFLKEEPVHKIPILLNIKVTSFV